MTESVLVLKGEVAVRFSHLAISREMSPDEFLEHLVKREQHPYGISGRMLEILKMSAQGYSAKVISDLLFFSTSTVKREKRRITEELKTPDFKSAIAEAIRRQLI